jgi:hypothetical protein
MACRSGEVHREALEIGERAGTESTFVSGAQDHARCLASLQRFLPTRCAETPTVARLQSGKAEFRSRCRKIIAPGLGELQKRRRHDRTDGMTPDVLPARVTAPIPKESRHGFNGAAFEAVTEDVAGRTRPSAALPAVIPQLYRLADQRRDFPAKPASVSARRVRLTGLIRYASKPAAWARRLSSRWPYPVSATSRVPRSSGICRSCCASS